MSDKATQSGDENVQFENCPDCGGSLEYAFRADVLCRDCEAVYFHEIRGARHLLWTDDQYLADEIEELADEIEARAGTNQNRTEGDE